MLRISDLAIQEFKSIINDVNNQGAGIRVYLKSGSCCQGPSIAIDLTETPAEPHTVHDFEGLKVFIEETAFDTAAGATIDFFPHSDNPGFHVSWDKSRNPGGCSCS